MNSQQDSDTSTDDRSAFARGSSRASQVITVCVIMALPALAGYWVDRKVGSVAVFTLVGIVFGCVYGTWRLLKFASSLNRTPDE